MELGHLKGAVQPDMVTLARFTSSTIYYGSSNINNVFHKMEKISQLHVNNWKGEGKEDKDRVYAHAKKVCVFLHEMFESKLHNSPNL